MNQFRNSWQKKFLFFLIIFLVLFAWADFALAKKCAKDEDCVPGCEKGKPCALRCINNKCVRALEIEYPKIDEGLTEETVVKEGLPAYVKYIFTFAVAFVGLVIFGVFIYNGILYLTSAGNPEKMRNAKDGILYAFFGGLILLASHLIFNTINPQLKIMELPKVKILEQRVVPGIYICNYKVENIDKVLEKYLKEGGETQIEGAKELREIIWNPQTKKGCPRVNFSGNLRNFQVTATGNTIFIVPTITYDPETKRRILKYEYGIVLHEKDNFRGKCDYFPKEDDKDLIYHQIEDFSAKNLKFTAYSVTLFQKPLTESVGDGVTLYQCFNYNREGKCNSEDPPLWKSFRPEGDKDIMKIKADKLGNLKDNTRSISFRPDGFYLALLYKEGFEGKCDLLHGNNPDLANVLSTGCLKGWLGFLNPIIELFKDCKPQLDSMIVIKGSVL